MTSRSGRVFKATRKNSPYEASEHETTTKRKAGVYKARVLKQQETKENVDPQDSKNVFELVRERLSYGKKSALKPEDKGTWVSEVFDCEKQKQKFADSSTLFEAFSTRVFPKMIEFENIKKNTKAKRDLVKTIREQIVKKLDLMATVNGYCCSSTHRYLSNEYEQKIQCKKCLKQSHIVCAQWNSLRDGPESEFVCNFCQQLFVKTVRTTDLSTLQKSSSSTFIETGINEFLVNEGFDGNMKCRLLACIRRSGMPERDAEQFPLLAKLMDKVPHTFKLYAVSQKLDQQEIIVFMLAVNEYTGSDVPLHKRGTTSIQFLDTVKYFEPRKLSRAVNQKLVQLYLQNAEKRGFCKARIFASAPVGDKVDYLIYGHPAFKANLSQTALFSWYEELCKRFVTDMKSRGIKVSCHNSFDPSHCKSVKSLCEELYMEEGFWPHHLERFIDTKGKKVSLAAMKKFVKEESEDRDGCQFYIYFNSNKDKKTQVDKDPFIHSDLAYSRDAWIEVQKNKNWQFDSFRRATFSTMMIISAFEDERNSQ